MNKLLASLTAAAILVSSAAFAGPDAMSANEPAAADTAATSTEAAPAKGDTAPVTKKHGKHHAKKAAHKKAKKAAAGK